MIILYKCNGSCNMQQTIWKNFSWKQNRKGKFKCSKFDNKNNRDANLMIKKVIQIKFEITIKSMWVQKSNRNMREKGYTWNPPKSACENGKYVGSIIDNSVMWNKIIEMTKSILTKTSPTKTIPTNFNEKKCFVKLKLFIFYLSFYLVSWHY